MLFLVRGRYSGVFVNCVECPIPEGTPGGALPGMIAFRGRRLWRWNAGAGETQQIALEGCETDRLAPEGVVVMHVGDLACVHPMTDAAVARMAAYPPWTCA